MSEILFFGIELFERVDPVRAVTIATFVYNDVETDFPAEQRSVAMRTVIFGLGRFFITIIGLKSR